MVAPPDLQDGGESFTENKERIAVDLMSAGFRIGVDLGGTKIEAAVIDPEGGIRLRRRVATPSGDYAATVVAVAALVHEIDAALGGRMTVGVGIPGTLVAATGLVKNANSTCLIGRPLGGDLETAIGRKVRLANDANCFALSEASDGAAAGCGNVFGVILGTGVGGGVVIGGRIVVGANAIAGEWGHNPLPWPQPDELPGLECYCGRRGCVETFLSGPALTADHRRHGGAAIAGERIVANAAAGDAACRATLDRYARRLARALAHVINILDPEAIVLGGGLSQIAGLYAAVPRHWDEFVFSDSVLTKLLPPKHGDSSGVRGAAWLWQLDEAG
jgi:fructokinase